MKQFYRNYFKSYFILILLAVTLNVNAQNDSLVTITGRAVDAASNEPLVGAAIILKSLSDTTQTQRVEADLDGNYTISTRIQFPVIIQVSQVGYEKYRLEVYELPEGPLELKVKSYILNEVVVVGYGVKKKKELTGSVSKIDPSDTKVIPDASFDAQLQGKASGVQINTNSGVPGSDVFIRIRGTTSINASNDPLYIIDGVFINNSSLQNIAQDRKTSPIADINPNDIESIEILKDASAIAIYGSRGANGVVIVTTKRGSYNQKPKIEFSASTGEAWAPKDRIWKTTTGPEHAMLVNEYRTNMGLPLNFVEGDRGTPESQPTYDRMSILNRQAKLQSYDLSVSGGNDATRYYLGGGYTKQEAIWKPMSFDRAAFKFNLDQKLTKKITIGTSNTLSRAFRNMARPANGGNGTLLQASLNIPTYLPIYLPDGTPAKWVNFDNIAVLTENVNLKSTSNHYIGNLYAEAEIIKGLRFRTTWGLDFNQYSESEYWDNRTLLGAAPTNGRASESVTQSSAIVNEQTLQYTKTFSRHTAGILVGNTLQGNIIRNSTAGGTNFPNNSYTQISAAANQTSSSSWSENKLASFFSRVDYSFADRYIIELTGRADGSTKFGENHRWGFFPAVGAAWRVKQEKFLKNVGWISNLKLRASYGIAGNQGGINDFASLGLWNGGYGYPDNATGGDRPGTAPLQLANPDLKWEKTSQTNAGIDIGVFKDRLNVEFNYYYKYTTDLLLPVALPGTTGYASYLTNYGEVSNKGFELAISSVNIEKKKFRWRTTFNIGKNINNVERIPAAIPYAGRDLIRLEEGSPLYSYWLYNQLYVDPQTGDAVFEDVNGDGQITASDRKIMGNTWPDFFGGITNSFDLFGFDANIFITYSYGNDVWNHNRMLGETGGTLDANRVLLASQLDRWTTPGQITDVPRLTAANYARQENSRFLEDGSFIRLRSLNIGYTVPEKVTEKLKVQKLRFYGVGTNLILLTKYTGSDPETNLGGDQNIQGYDYALPPMPRSVQFGVNVTLQ